MYFSSYPWSYITGLNAGIIDINWCMIQIQQLTTSNSYILVPNYKYINFCSNWLKTVSVGGGLSNTVV